MPVTASSLRTVGELFRSAQGPLYSFEFFPPRSEDEEPILWAAVEALTPLEPSFVSVTYGANGSRRDRTIRATRRIAASGGPLTVGHLTCVGQSKAELAEALAEYREAGVTNILAIRGDMPGGGEWTAHPDGLANATELVRFVKSEGEFCVGVAAFANPHETSNDPDLDAQILLDKVEAGAEFAITQLFFEGERYGELVSRMRGLSGRAAAGLLVERGGAGGGPGLRGADVSRSARRRCPRAAVLHPEPLEGHPRGARRAEGHHLRRLNRGRPVGAPDQGRSSVAGPAAMASHTVGLFA